MIIIIKIWNQRKYSQIRWAELEVAINKIKRKKKKNTCKLNNLFLKIPHFKKRQKNLESNLKQVNAKHNISKLWDITNIMTKRALISINFYVRKDIRC